MKVRDYRLEGPCGKEAAEQGLVSAQWFACKIDRKQMKALMQRSDAQGLKYLGGWLALFILSGLISYLAWPSLWAIPAFFVYGLFYAASEHAAHELSHGTPFKTRWLNVFFEQLVAFLAIHEPVFWRWSHARHHTDTLIVGNDREIAFPRPVKFFNLLLDFFFIRSGSIELLRTFKHALGIVSPTTRLFVPESEIKRMVRSSQAHAAIYIIVLILCFYNQSILPALFIGLPRFFGAPLTQVFNITQHAGLQENVLDHRINTRTVILHPILRNAYFFMNYHVEHHMFPMVPFYNLPKLHELMKDQCVPANPNLINAFKEIIPAIWRQRKEPNYYIKRVLPRDISDTVTTAQSNDTGFNSNMGMASN